MANETIDSRQVDRDDWKRMHMELTDPEKKEEARRKVRREKLLNDKRIDVGL